MTRPLTEKVDVGAIGLWSPYSAAANVVAFCRSPPTKGLKTNRADGERHKRVHFFPANAILWVSGESLLKGVSPMPSGGHNAKPKAVKVHEGTYRRDRAKYQQVPTGSVPKKPRGLGKEGSKLWDRVVEVRKLWIDESDLESLTILCRTWDELTKVSKHLAELGPGHANADKVTRRFSMLSKDFRAMSACFGLDPASRERLGETGIPQDLTNAQLYAKFLA